MTYLKSNHLFARMQIEDLYLKIPRPLVLADELRNPDNAGALIRLADNLGAAGLWFLTNESQPYLPKMRRVAASSYGNLPWEIVYGDHIPSYLIENRTVVACETTKNAVNLFTIELPINPLFVVGNERNGIRPEVLKQADLTVFIPVPGSTRSLNVTHAASVLFFEWYRQMSLRVK